MVLAVSGTSTFNLTVDDIIDRSYTRAFGEQQDGYDLRTAAINLGLLLQEIQVGGAPLWCMEEVVIKASMAIADAGQYTLDPTIVDVADVWTRNITTTPNGDDLAVSRIPATTYNLIPNKQDAGRSYQYYLDRQRDAMVMKLYPVVNVNATYALYARAIRRLYDVGDYTNYVDAPVRWLPTIIAGLAWYTARDNRKMLGKEWVDDARADYIAAYSTASFEDTDSSPTRIEIDASAYFGR